MLKHVWNTRQVGPVFLISAALLAVYVLINVDYINAKLTPLVAAPTFATTALSSLGLISLFVGLLYQRRFQRADDLVRQISLIREVLHPDYREQLGLKAGYTRLPEGLDPRYADKHQRTVDVVRSFREYRQLFQGVPLYSVAFALIYVLAVGVALIFWTLSLSGTGWLEITFHAAALAITAQSFWLLGHTLWLVSWFPHRGEDLTVEERLGIPGWYKLLDVRYLSRRSLPFGPLVAALECYLMLSRRRGPGRDQWVLYFQLPLPLREWEWRCTVFRANQAICQHDWERVSLSPAEADRFFTRPGYWMQTEVAAWSADRFRPSEFDEVVVSLELRGVGESEVLILTAPASGSGWYEADRDQGPMRYPWYTMRLWQRNPVTTGNSRTALVYPQAGTLADQGAGEP